MNILVKTKYLLILIINAFSFINSQDIANLNSYSNLLNESKLYYDETSATNTKKFQLIFSQSAYINTNLPNFENINGLYLSKGHGSVSNLFIKYNNEFIDLSIQPELAMIKHYDLSSLPIKNKEFSKLNDVPLNPSKINYYPRNLGLKLHFKDISIGYGNWNQWLGPGIHNSLILSNNSKGFYHYSIETKNKYVLSKNLSIKGKYLVSDAIKNSQNNHFFFSILFFNLFYKNIEFGYSKQILNGGYEELSWDQADALSVLITQKNIKYWDLFRTYFIALNFHDSNLKLFFEWGYPLQTFSEDYDPEIYYDHLRATNLGLRKYGAFGNNNMIFGFEYARIVQGLYFNKIPTQNWYDNHKYDYSSYSGRRWAAHSGADSDDFLAYIGIIYKDKSFIYEVNYERHGVTYNFPPEVKFESRIALSYKLNNTFLYLRYENEHFEHYGFVDSNNNVWEQSFEPGSVQRTKTIMLSFDYYLNY